MEIELSNPTLMLKNGDSTGVKNCNSTDLEPEILPFCPTKSQEFNSVTIPLTGKELWKKASVKVLTWVRMNNFNKFINNVYYGIGVEDKDLDDSVDEEVEWLIHKKKKTEIKSIIYRL